MRLGVIGCGNVTLNFHLPAWRTEPRVQIVAAADPTPARLQVFRDQAGLSPSACSADAADVLARTDVEAVLVATPPRYRPPIVLDAIRAGKHVLCEKPIAPTPADAWAMARAARSAGLVMAMVHNYYYMPDVALVKRVLDAGVIGQPYLVTLNFLGVEDLPGAAEYQPVWRHDAATAGGGVLMDMLHAVYVVAWLMGDQPFRSVSAAVDRRAGGADSVEDVALCRFAFDRGFGLINMAWGQGPGGIEIMGAEGRLLLFYRHFGTGPFQPAEQLHVYRGLERVPVDLELQPGSGMQRIIADFIESVEQRREPHAPAEQGCATLEAVLGAYASAARQRVIRLPLDPADPIFARGMAGLREPQLVDAQPPTAAAG